MPKAYLDPRWANPGVSGCSGINQSTDRLNMGDYGCWYAENVEPSFLGWTNYKLGCVKRNTTTPANSKVQGIIGLGDCLYFVVNGNFYCMDDSSGVVTMPTGGAGIFDTTATVRMAKNQGKNGTVSTKIYACDGVNTSPRRFSSATNTISNFSFGGTYTTPLTVNTWQRRVGWTFKKGSVDESRLLFSQEEDGDEYTTSGSALIDAFDDYVWVGDGDHIVGFGSVQFKGQDAQSDALIVCKSQRSFMATEVNLGTNERFMTFNNNGVDVGAVSPDAMIQFGNDLWILTKTGIKGFNAVLDGSGGVSAFSSSPVDGMNKLVETSSLNSAFENAFAVHHSAKKKIRFFMPRNASSSTVQNGFTYPEIPMDYALNYGYGVLPKHEGNPRGEALYARGGAGFAFSCACEHKGRLFLGDYFGNIYEMDCEDAGDDHIPSSGTDQIIYGQFTTPFMKFGADEALYDGEKRMIEVVLDGRSSGEVEYNFDLTYIIDKPPYQKTLPTLTKITGSTGNSGGVYGSSKYGQAKYASQAGVLNQIRVKAPGHFNAVGIRNWFPSKRLVNGSYKSNHIWIYKVTGAVEVKG